MAAERAMRRATSLARDVITLKLLRGGRPLLAWDRVVVVDMVAEGGRYGAMFLVCLLWRIKLLFDWGKTEL